MVPLLVIFLFTSAVGYPPHAPLHPPSTAERIRQHGYPVETHKILTEDGYILTAFRIPHGLDAPLKKPKPVIVQHGILCSSDCWVLTGNSQSLGYALADAGFDVWLTNSRGNSYSREHVKWKPNNSKFWDFSFHELGYYDIPATIDHILNVTGENNLFYIGHSQGTAIFFVMASTRPFYNTKVKAMSALAPIAFLDDTKGAVKSLNKISSWLIDAAYVFKIHHVLDHSIVLAVADRILCSVNWEICNEFVSFIVGFDSPHLNKGLLPYLAEICPTGASVKQLVHFAQLLKNGGRFTWYDYGFHWNRIIYNSTSPPEYNLTSITTPILLYYGPNDYISSMPEVKKIFSKLRFVADVKEIATFNHLDFMWATDVKQQLYNHVIQKFKTL